METLTVGKLAKAAGINIETIRYYERRGLIAEPERSLSGYRHYPDSVLTRMRFIRHAKDMGFTLQEIKELLDLCVDPNSPCIEVKKRAESKIAEIEEKIEHLKNMKKSLSNIASQCSGGSAISDCTIVKTLEK